MELSLATIAAAHQRIQPYVRATPLLPPPTLQADLPAGLRLKLENLQLTGSFKVRGVFNALLQLDRQQLAHGVVASSGGNHGVAVAYAASVLGLPATIWLPAGASQDRVDRIAAWGARVIRHGIAWDDAHARGLAKAAASGAAYIHPFDDPAVMAGQATLGLELLAALPELDALVVAIGGGGLIGGLASAIKQQRPAVRIIGVEPVGAASMQRSLAAGQVVPLSEAATIADTLAPRAVSARTLAIAQRLVERVVLVEDRQLVDGMRWLWREANQLVEPAGAAAIAALRAVPGLLADCRQPVALICGGNAAAAGVFDDYAARCR